MSIITQRSPQATGYVGNFVTKITSDRGPAEIKHGAAVIAIGIDMYTPTEYLYGQDERVLTHLELEEKIVNDDEKVLGAKNLVMIQCVGCRNEDRNYCSRICCSESVKNALLLKEKNPAMDIYILFRDVRTYGFKEDFYREAAGKDVKFIRYEPDRPPVVEPGEGEEDGRPVLKVTATGLRPRCRGNNRCRYRGARRRGYAQRGNQGSGKPVQGNLKPRWLLQRSPCETAAR